MEIALLFSGSPNCSIFIVGDDIIGWGKPTANYFFQMWRDIPSHVIYYRDLIGEVDFLSNITMDPLEIPQNQSFRYDFLAKGDVPPGFWINFTAGINSEGGKGFLKNILYKVYNAETNNLDQFMIYQEPLSLNFEDFAILLTNLTSSTGMDQIFDHSDRNILVGEDDAERREFNSVYYRAYLSYIVDNLENNFRIYLKYFLRLSGSHLLAYLIDTNTSVDNKFFLNLDILNSLPSYLIHPLVEELLSNNPKRYSYLKNTQQKLQKEMESFQNKSKDRFFMNYYS